MKNNEFKELVDWNLSGLEWDERKRLRVLHAIDEEERPVKKISYTFILVAAILCISVTALADGLVFSKKVDDLTLAKQELEKAYGVTETMLGSYFCDTVEQKEDETVVTFWCNDNMNYVLGEYTVTIKDGKATARWSHDGEDTSGGFESEAWGVDQMNAMLEWEKEHRDVSAYYPQATEIAKKHHAEIVNEGMPSDEEIAAILQLQEDEEQQARAAAKLSEPEMIEMAREAVKSVYDLSEEQMGLLLISNLQEDEEDEEESYYGMQDDKPVYTVWFWLHQAPDDDDPTTWPEFTEKDGVYLVDVNVETGVIERVYYETGMGANG